VSESADRGTAQDDDGLPITQHEFDAQLERYLVALDDTNAALTADDYVALVRLWNTIKWGRSLTGEALVGAFEARFFPREVPTLTSVLQMTPTKGMALYSRERDLYLGGPPHANSMYKVLPD
jgi:hypothetical protein